MNITVAGGGNVGTQLAVHCAAKQHRVTLYTSNPQTFQKHLVIVNEDGRVTKEGEIDAATDDAEKAFSGADLILVTVPAFCMGDLAKKILPYVKSGAQIGLIPGSGGGECAFREHVKNGGTIFGLQRVPSVARLVVYGQKVCAIGYREQLFLAALPAEKAGECCRLVSGLLDMPCAELPGYLNVTLTPSNPIIHTSRLYAMFTEYKEGMSYERIPLFYEEWEDSASELLLACDGEVQQICKALAPFDLQGVKSLKEYYESDTAEKLTKKIRSIEGFKRIKTPMVSGYGGYIPDLDSRYFTADFSYGLSILRQIADFAGVEVPVMEKILGWYGKIAKHKKEFSYREYGIESLGQFREFYKM